MRTRMTLASGFAALALLAGCGGDDAPIEPVGTESTTAPSTTASKRDYIVGADARCAEANAAIASLQSGSDSGNATASGELEITQGVLEGLRGLGDPPDPSGSLQRYLAALEDQVRILEQQQSAVSSGDLTGAEALAADLDAARSDAATAAESYGFDDCGGTGTAVVAPDGGSTVPESAPSVPDVPSEPAVPTVPPVPTDPAPPAPEAPAPAPAPPSGGTGGATPPAPPADPGGDGGGGSGSGGGIGPG